MSLISGDATEDFERFLAMTRPAFISDEDLFSDGDVYDSLDFLRNQGQPEESGRAGKAGRKLAEKLFEKDGVRSFGGGELLGIGGTGTATELTSQIVGSDIVTGATPLAPTSQLGSLPSVEQFQASQGGGAGVGAGVGTLGGAAALNQIAASSQILGSASLAPASQLASLPAIESFAGAPAGAGITAGGVASAGVTAGGLYLGARGISEGNEEKGALGGAIAGFQIGGPVGGVIGAVVGGVGAMLNPDESDTSDEFEDRLGHISRGNFDRDNIQAVRGAFARQAESVKGADAELAQRIYSYSEQLDRLGTDAFSRESFVSSGEELMDQYFTDLEQGKFDFDSDANQYARSVLSTMEKFGGRDAIEPFRDRLDNLLGVKAKSDVSPVGGREFDILRNRFT